VAVVIVALLPASGVEGMGGGGSSLFEGADEQANNRGRGASASLIY
jgi:hypothetical protein